MKKGNCSCGYPSQARCRDMFNTVLAKEFSDFRYARVHRLTVDAYSLQHPDEFMISGKSFAAHLTGMFIAIELNNDPALLLRLQRWLNGPKMLDRPDPPESFGRLTLATVMKAEGAAEHIRLVWKWAREVWDAWYEFHPLAAAWIESAQKEPRPE